MIKSKLFSAYHAIKAHLEDKKTQKIILGMEIMICILIFVTLSVVLLQMFTRPFIILLSSFSQPPLVISSAYTHGHLLLPELGVYTQYFAVFPIVATYVVLMLYLILHMQWQKFIPFTVVCVLNIITFIPWLHYASVPI